MEKITFSLITPDGVKYENDVYEVVLPTPNGQVGILAHHAPLISLATSGVISIRHNPDEAESQLEHLATSGGLIEVDGNSVRLLADTAEHANDIDELRAKEALAQAQELQKTAKDHIAAADATALIERNLARLKVTELRRRHQRHRTD